jgi:RNA polymerase sigma factor (sigma-70 family)
VALVTRDPELVRRCLDGDRAAWSLLLERYADLVYSICRRAGLDHASAADVFQDVSVMLWKRLPRLRRAESLLSWVSTTARRASWRAKKRGAARAARQTAVARREDTGAPSAEATLKALEEEQAVRQAFASLGEPCRRLLEALYFAGGAPTYAEVAQRLGIPKGSIGPTRQRCLDGLRRALADLGFAGTPPADRVSGEGGAASTSLPPGGTGLE